MLLRKDRVDTVAIGGFDGIHRGHMKLIERLGENGALVVVDKDNANITPMSKRSEYSKYPCMYYHFSKIKPLTGKEFVELLKGDFPKLKKIVIGYDFIFGVDRSCGAKDLKSLFKGEVEIVDEYIFDGISVHSTIIRELIKSGNISQANRLLGREYSIIGNIIKGQGLGKKELYPTLNLHVLKYLYPKNGVYATRTIVGEKVYESVTFLGIRHSVDENFSVETHILGETSVENIDWVEVLFVEFLRENRKFSNLKDLKSQITKDIQKVREVLF